jgi:hypothetical protein
MSQEEEGAGTFKNYTSQPGLGNMDENNCFARAIERLNFVIKTLRHVTFS